MASVSCECGEATCGARIELAHGERPRAAQHPHYRIVAPGHVQDGDVLVDDRDDYWIVRRTDPEEDADDPSALSFPASDPPAGPART